MKKIIILYGLAIAIAAIALDWLEYKYALRIFSTEIYIALIALGFTALGIWAGFHLTRKVHSDTFTRNDAALKSLGVTDREFQVLELLVVGYSNKEVARNLGISPNTIKTHIANLFEKLEVERRTQAIHKAKLLNLIP